MVASKSKSSSACTTNSMDHFCAIVATTVPKHVSISRKHAVITTIELVARVNECPHRYFQITYNRVKAIRELFIYA